MATEKKRYDVLVGLDYPPSRRAEAGDTVDDIPAMSIPWLLEQGYIREHVAAPSPADVKASGEDRRATQPLTKE